MACGDVLNASKIRARKNLKIHAKNLKNEGLIQSNESLILSLVKSALNMQDIHTEGHCIINVSEGNFINKKGRLFANNFLKIDVFDLQNNYGIINTNNDMLITAKEVVNKRGDVKYCKSSARPVAQRYDVKCYCQGDQEFETTDPALLLCGKNLTINCLNLVNDASGIFSSESLKVNAKNIENRSHFLKNDQRWIQKIRVRKHTFGITHSSHDEYLTGIDSQPFFVPACLMAGNTLECIIGDKYYPINEEKIPNFINTGIVQSRNMKLQALDQNRQAEFINGIWAGNQLTPIFKRAEPVLQIIPFINQVGELSVFTYKPKDKSYVYMVLPNKIRYDDNWNERPSRLVVQENKRLHGFKGSERIDMHPVVLAETMARMCQKIYGVPLLDLRDKTIFNQVDRFLSEGVKYASSLRNEASSQGIIVLTREEIQKAPLPMIFYQAGSYKGEDGFMSFFFLPKQQKLLAEKTEGIVFTDNLNVNIPVIKNSGSIISQENLTIKSYAIENKQPMFVTKELVKTKQGGLFSSDRVQVYDIKIPQVGGNIIGARVSISAQDIIKNNGGSIFGTVKVELLANEGSVETNPLIGTRIIRWDVGKWGCVLGAQCASLAPVYYPGKIYSEGELKIRAGNILLLASEIIGSQALTIESGNNGTQILDTFGKYVCKDSISSHGLSFSRSKAEAEVYQPTTLLSEGAIILSSQGKNIIRGSLIQGKLVDIFSEKGNELLTSKQALKYQQNRCGISGAGIYANHQDVVQEVLHNTQVLGEYVKIESTLDNELEGTFVCGDRAVHIKAGRNNVLRGASQKTEIEENGWGISLNFFGSSLLKGEELTDITNDPLIQNIKNLINTKSETGAIYNATFSAMAICNALQQYKECGTLKNFFGNRFGVTDKSANFNPQLSLCFSCYNFKQTIENYLSGRLQADDITIESSGDTFLMDGEQVYGKTCIAITTNGNLITDGAKCEKSLSMETQGVSISNQKTLSTTTGNTCEHSTTYRPSEITGKKVDVKVGRDAILENTKIKGEQVDIAINGKFEQTVKQDSCTAKSFGASLAGSVISNNHDFSFSVSSSEKSSVRSMTAGIYTDQDLSLEADEIKLIGTDLQSRGTIHLETNRFEYSDVIDTSDGETLEVHFNLPATGSVIMVPLVIKSSQQCVTEIRKATIDGFEVESDVDLMGVNRSIEDCRKLIEDDDSEVCVCVPVVDPKAFAALLNEFCKKAAEFVLEHPEYCQVFQDHILKDDMEVESLRPNDFLENTLENEIDPFEIKSKKEVENFKRKPYGNAINSKVEYSLKNEEILGEKLDHFCTTVKRTDGIDVRMDFVQKPKILNPRESLEENPFAPVPLGNNTLDSFVIDPSRLVAGKIQVTLPNADVHTFQFDCRNTGFIGELKKAVDQFLEEYIFPAAQKAKLLGSQAWDVVQTDLQPIINDIKEHPGKFIMRKVGKKVGEKVVARYAPSLFVAYEVYEGGKFLKHWYDIYNEGGVDKIKQQVKDHPILCLMEGSALIGGAKAVKSCLQTRSLQKPTNIPTSPKKIQYQQLELDLGLTSKISESRASVSKIKTSRSSTSGKTNPSLGVSSKQLEFNFVEDIKDVKKCVKSKSKVVYQKPTSTRVTSQKNFTQQLDFDFIKNGPVKQVEDGKFKKTTRSIHGEPESAVANNSIQLEFDF